MTILRLGRRAMGSRFEILACGAGEEELRCALEEALEEVGRLEDQLSLFLPGSEVNFINARAYHAEVTVESRLHSFLRRCAELSRKSAGAFAPVQAGFEKVRFGRETIRFLDPGVALDLGAIGKGYALERAADILREHGIEHALLHGGQSTIYAMGHPPGEVGWKVGLADPETGDRLGSIVLRNQALSASSNHGEKEGHVIDPRDGRPAQTRAAWALCDSPTEADAWSTAFLVLGWGGAKKILRERNIGASILEKVPHPIHMDVAWETREPTLPGRDVLKGVAAVAAFGLLPRKILPLPEQGSKLSVALIGAGKHGEVLLGHLKRMPGIRIAAVCDTREKRLKKSLEIAGQGIETYQDFEYLLEEEEVDAILVATPSHLHAPVALAALERGRHVFCEAPLAHTREDCRKLALAAQQSKKVFQVGHQRRTSALYPHALKHIRSGAIGSILQVRAQWSQKRSWKLRGKKAERETRNWRLYKKSSGGLLLEYGSHLLDLVRWYTGADPIGVVGMGAIAKWKDEREVDDSVQAIFRYPGDVLVNYHATLVNSHGGERELFVGEAAAILIQEQKKGLLFKESDTVEAGWEQYAKKEMLGEARGIILDANATKYDKHEKGEEIGPESNKADFFVELEQFFSAVREGTSPACTAVDGMAAATAALGAVEALETGKEIRFSAGDFEVK